jgi:hypothetical protein
MMDLAQLETAARLCDTKLQALELVRRETQAMLHCFSNLTEDDARTIVRNRILYVAASRMSPADAARVLALFEQPRS